MPLLLLLFSLIWLMLYLSQIFFLVFILICPPWYLPKTHQETFLLSTKKEPPEQFARHCCWIKTAHPTTAAALGVAATHQDPHIMPDYSKGIWNIQCSEEVESVTNVVRFPSQCKHFDWSAPTQRAHKRLAWKELRWVRAKRSDVWLFRKPD